MTDSITRRDWSRTKTDDMMQELAKDAGIGTDARGRPMRVHSSAIAPTATELRKGEHAKGNEAAHAYSEYMHEAKDHVADLAVDATELLEEAHGLGELGSIGGELAASFVIAGTLATTAALYAEGIERPWRKADAQMEAHDNDALNLGVVHTLDYKAGFVDDQVHARREVEAWGGTKVVEALKTRDAAMIPVLQARSDEGVRVGLMAESYAQAFAPADRDEARAEFMKRNGYGDRLEHDLAFGKGVEYASWMTTHLSPVELRHEIGKLDERDARSATPTRVGG